MRAIANREGPQRVGAELGGAVHQYWRFGAVNVWRLLREELCRHSPCRARRRFETHGHGTILEAADPHQGGGHVDVRVRWIDDRYVPSVRSPNTR
jgi:hypothetical protein